MKFNPTKSAIWIADQSALESVIKTLANIAYLAVDTESNSLYAYKEQVCLIQFSTTEDDYLIDAKAGLDFSNLASLFRNRAIEKIFHAAEYDVICLRRDFGFEFNNLFDTMQAARILGFNQFGLSNLLEGQFHIEPVKSFQKANWGKRPLSQEMIEYARLDTHFLYALRERLYKQLEEKELVELAKEDFRRVSYAKNNNHHAPLYTQISGYHKLTPQQLPVLDALCIYRDVLAAAANRPHFKIIGHKALYAIAENSPASIEALREIEALSPRLAKRYGQGLIDAVMRGMNAQPINLARKKRPSKEYIKRIEALKQWRKNKGEKMGVQSDVVLPKDLLEMIAGQNPRDISGIQLAMREVPWRFKHFGIEILNAINQGISV